MTHATLTRDAAHHFAREWIAAWNARDLPRVLAHYADEVEMSSPFIAAVTGDASGVVRGKAALHAYWSQALAKFPELRFELLGVFTGVSSLVLRYKSVRGVIACETLEFDASGKIRRASAHYNETDLAKAAADDTWFFTSHLTPILNVSDIPASLAWFERLGWRTCWKWPFDGASPPTFAAVGAGECEIFLCKNGQGGRGKGANTSTGDGEGQDDTADQGVWMSVWVADVDAVQARCLANGLEITMPPRDEPWGVREMHVRHPDGHVFRISRGSP